MTIPTTCKTFASLLMAAAVLQGCTPTPKIMDSSIIESAAVEPETPTLLTSSENGLNTQYVVDSDQKVILSADNSCVRASSWIENNIVECQSSAQPMVSEEPVAVENAVGSTLVSLNGSALFEFDSAELSDSGRMELNKLTSKLNSQNEIKQIEIIGHADSVGNDSYNQSLSELRASATKAYLQQSLQTVAVTAKGMGESAPIADNSTAEGRRLNRRVDVVIAARVES